MKPMSDTKPPASQAEALAKQLKASLAQRRPRPWKLVLATLTGSVVVLVLLAWWLYPGPIPAPLQVIALDAVYNPDETPHARAQLFAAPQIKEPRRLSGYTVVFHERGPLVAPGAQPRAIVAKSDERGQASVEWQIDQAHAEFLVLHVEAEQRRGSPHDGGRIYVWPKDAPLLIVDVDETLIADELNGQASETLTKAATEGWRIIYLSLASAQPHEFRTARGWIEKQANLPNGPVLGRTHLSDEETIEEARRDVLKQLQGQFPGSMCAVVKSAESARVCKALGLRTIVVGAAPAPPEALHAPTWADVPFKLK
jgi:hypothetical protein